MREGALILCVVLAGCASGGTGQVRPGAGVREETTRVETGGGTLDMRTTRSDPTAAFEIAAPPDRVYRALSTVYEGLSLKVNALDTQSRRVGAESARVRRVLGGTRLSRYLECGERLGSKVADTDEVTLTLITQVSPASDGSTSTLRTLFEASARPLSTSGNPIACATTGDLEERIVSMVREAVK